MTIAQEIELSPLPAPTRGSPAIGIPSLPFLASVRVRLTACVGEVTMSVADLLGMQVGSLVQLDRLVDQPIDLVVDQHVVARGTLVAVDEHFGVRLTEPPSMSTAANTLKS